jgi:hypothetical protein
VTVDIDRLETGAWSPSLSIDPAGGIGGQDHWTWLTPDEARKVAAMLTEAANAADVRSRPLRKR